MRPTTFAPSPMSGLVDVPMRYDLAESTCPPVRVRDLLDDGLVERLRRAELGYGTTQGDPDLRGLIAAGAGVRPDQVLVTAGGAAALTLLAMVLGAGAHVVLATPCFPPARTLPEALGLRVTPVPLRFDDGYRLDPDAVAAALTPATRLVSLASPQNPAGVRLADDALARLVAQVARAAPDAVILVDETYRETVYGDRPAPRSVAGLAPRVVTCSSLSKSHGVPGLRVGWLTSTDPQLYDSLRAAKFASSVCCPTVDEILGAEVLRRAEDLLAPRRSALRAALGELEEWAAAHATLVDYLRPDGGALCCLRLRADRYDEVAVADFHAALAGRGIRVAPGSWFGESDRVFRLGFGHLSPADFTDALTRLGGALTATAAPAGA